MTDQNPKTPSSPTAATTDQPIAGGLDAPAAAAPAIAPSPSSAAPPRQGHWWWGTGRRKSAVARVRLRAGKGQFVVNGRAYDQYFTEERDRQDLTNVLNQTRTAGSVDIHVNVSGGGFTGQAGAIILGVSRALCKYDQSLEPVLREHNLLTRDPRRVERKKYGQPGARRRFQFSKR
jgi:small subunit ribosomal protein S9